MNVHLGEFSQDDELDCPCCRRGRILIHLGERPMVTSSCGCIAHFKLNPNGDSLEVAGVLP